jgi:hypothetical protein
VINRHVAKVVADPDNPEELCLDFPDELLENMGWVVGDELVFEEMFGQWIIKKVEGYNE